MNFARQNRLPCHAERERSIWSL